MQQHLIRPPKKAKRRRRVGRGDSSGYGSYAGRGVKGQKSRTGAHRMTAFMGGQLSLLKRLPSIRGFTNIFRQEYWVVNLDQLGGFPEDTVITPQAMVEAGIIRNLNNPVKVLGRGDLEGPILVEAHRYSKTASEKIQAMGGSAEVIE
ncbi:MAG: 50S ribosomal protein L15 [SAR202 cluster bacterium]|jgi:large subunit ribosomal protein L15|nr:50S ribosomal protein L15 [Chloroflexota bacterium]MDP6420710.1 50S ribosomal protein L15 [SAR202 cluster bacterium]HAL48622.1 50S ribosomal protein L15 [Dehalococcoidia bacterium]MDP6663773.1 50S ribosomal protein L15 [SAR202 cluster bacterium]MDP6798584.1 50S ribosomal protein L15 [SAR202 cluster bacterium]|tara:strand:- start:725 stop:1168 length:444 start_codon:yes stop_codon:yes gene_type:complete